MGLGRGEKSIGSIKINDLEPHDQLSTFWAVLSTLLHSENDLDLVNSGPQHTFGPVDPTT